MLQRMQCWDELEPVARKAIALHQTYPHQFRLARAYGFLAEVALAKSAWKQAQESAQQALTILDNAASTAENSVSSETIADLEWEQSSHRGWYLFALARAQLIASGSEDKTLKLWNLEGQEIKTIKGDESVKSVSFSPDSQTIVSLSGYNLPIKLWRHDGTLLTTFERFGSNDVSFSPDGKSIAAAGENGVSVWNFDLNELLKRGCNIARDYLKNNPKAKSDSRSERLRQRTLCDNIK